MKKQKITRVFSLILALIFIIGMCPVQINAMSVAEIESQITSTYYEALARSGESEFKGKCGKFVNWHLVILGINTSYVYGDGNDQFDNYKDKSTSTGGYPIHAYSAGEYTLESALNAICGNGTIDVYNIVVGLQQTKTSPEYGHAFFIHAIIDGTVYYSESYDAYIGGTTYAEGSVIKISISQLADYYGQKGTFEGVIHFGESIHYPDYSVYIDEDYPCYVNVKTDGAYKLWNMPCSDDTSSEAKELARTDADTTYLADRIYLNKRGIIGTESGSAVRSITSLLEMYP